MSVTSSSRLARRWRRPVSSCEPARPARVFRVGAVRAGRRGGAAGLELVQEAEELLGSRLPGPAGGVDLELLALVDPAGLGDDGARLAYVALCDRVAAHAAWLASRALVAVAGERPSGALMSEVAIEHEVAVARGCSIYAAGRAIEAARLLAGPFGRFAAALRVGEVSQAHVNVLVEGTRNVVDEGVLEAVCRRVLPTAGRSTPRQLSGQVARAVADLDPDAAARHRRAKDGRRVWTSPLPDGMGFLGVVDDQATITAIAATLDADAAALKTARGGAAAVAAGDQGARMDPCRADALATRILGTVTEQHHTPEGAATEGAAIPAATSEGAAIPGTALGGAATPGSAGADGCGCTVTFTRAPVPVVLHVVIDLETLCGERDRMALLEGQPIPGPVAREYAEGAVAWRRMVTDPVDGHLLDFGTTSYLPGPLRRYVLARDGGCRSPVCTVTSPRRIQLDHARPYPAGPSSTANTGGLCGTDHQLKTAGHLTITDSGPDGTCTWTTALGQTRHIPPRPFLHDPHDEACALPARPPAAHEPTAPTHDTPQTRENQVHQNAPPHEPPF